MIENNEDKNYPKELLENFPSEFIEKLKELYFLSGKQETFYDAFAEFSRQHEKFRELKENKSPVEKLLMTIDELDAGWCGHSVNTLDFLSSKQVTENTTLGFWHCNERNEKECCVFKFKVASDQPLRKIIQDVTDDFSVGLLLVKRSVAELYALEVAVDTPQKIESVLDQIFENYYRKQDSEQNSMSQTNFGALPTAGVDKPELSVAAKAGQMFYNLLFLNFRKQAYIWVVVIVCIGVFSLALSSISNVRPIDMSTITDKHKKTNEDEDKNLRCILQKEENQLPTIASVEKESDVDSGKQSPSDSKNKPVKANKVKPLAKENEVSNENVEVGLTESRVVTAVQDNELTNGPKNRDCGN